MTEHGNEICEELLTSGEDFCLLVRSQGIQCIPSILTRSCNNCCNWNATICRLCNVVDSHLAVNNVKACNFAMQTEHRSPLVLLSNNKIIRTAVNLNALLFSRKVPDIFVRQ